MTTAMTTMTLMMPLIFASIGSELFSSHGRTPATTNLSCRRRIQAPFQRLSDDVDHGPPRGRSNT